MKIKFLFPFFFFMLTLTLNVKSQDRRIDIVYLKNGNDIQGKIIEWTPQQIKIQTTDQSLFIFNTNEIKKISKDTLDYRRKNIKKFLVDFDISYMLGTGKSVAGVSGHSEIHTNNYHAFGLRFIEAYKFLKNSSMGFGIGYENYTTDDKTYLPNTEYIPVFLHARTSFPLKANVLPGLNMDLGYDIGITTAEGVIFKGGAFLNPSLCLQLKSQSGLSTFLYFGYEYQSHSFKLELGADDAIPFLLSSHFLTFRAGIEF